MSRICESSWLQAWYILWCDEDWEHTYGLEIESVGDLGWKLHADLIDTVFEARPDQSGEFRRTSTDWINWKVTSGAFEASGGPWNLVEIVATFRSWVQGLEFEPRPVESVSRFLIETLQSEFEDLRDFAWLEWWYSHELGRCSSPYMEISTLDNPGWSVKVRMSTPALNAAARSELVLPKIKQGWFEWRIEGDLLALYGGPQTLTDHIEVLRRSVAAYIEPSRRREPEA